jgi:hypothetical protein
VAVGVNSDGRREVLGKVRFEDEGGGREVAECELASAVRFTSCAMLSCR